MQIERWRIHSMTVKAQMAKARMMVMTGNG